MPQAVTDATFADEVIASELPVFVDFWAEWCPPCHRLAPVLDELAEEYAGRIRFVKVDCDANPALARRYGILSMPTLSVFVGGQVVSQRVGAQPRARLRAQLDEALAPAVSGVQQRAA
ncbi:thioredoxin 1 [Allocatelliglobosispora scoriae]|uniref:Thioredoxin n=1 Tax=Allocatelliglobosispora scoriae TaxID=643052 RepID=A0A841BZX5_9ACTN|nr:thioredoxin [Allocatelliglobosispora scoriae]MBB5872443.1 thioredoxin 1 [Allocatelliglobosispora scoriae]